MAFAIEKKGKVFFSLDKRAIELSRRSFFGNIEDNKVIYEFYESLFLLEEGKAIIKEKDKKLSLRDLLKSLKEKEIMIYRVYRDLRKKGYILKSGTKFGAELIVYEKGKKPGRDHSRWTLEIYNRRKKINIKDLVAKMRIAHSTKKKLLLAIVEENKVIYYELEWKKM